MITKNDFKVLMTLFQNGCTTEMKSFTVKKLIDITGLSLSKVRDSVSAFKSLDYIAEGVCQRSAKTYYITADGIRKIKIIIGEEKHERENIV